MPPLAQPIYTAAEYLRLERAAEHKSEFVNGRIHAMTGASRAHNLIVGNIFGEIRARLRGRPCEVYVNDMRVKVRQTGLYTYPDVAAVCGAPQFEDDVVDTLLNPSVIVEVLSDSTEKYDRGTKFSHYRRLESLREYILVSQDRPSVEKFVRTNELWTLEEISGPDAMLTIESLDCSISLSDIYGRVEFPPGELGPAITG